MGSVETTAQELLNSQGRPLSVIEQKKKSASGHLTVTASVRTEEVAVHDILAVNFAGRQLANKDEYFGELDPYLVISRYKNMNFLEVCKILLQLSQILLQG
jgi:hypothetical protein